MHVRSSTVSRILLAIVLLWLVTGQASAQHNAGSGEKVATVNGTIITRADFDRELERFRQQYAAMGRSIDDSQLAEIKKDVLDNLIAGELLYQKSQEENITIDEAEVNAYVEELKTRFAGEEEFKKALSTMNLSEKAIRSDFERAKSIGRLIDERIYKNIAVSDEQMKQFYETNQNLFMQPEQVRARHILIKTAPNASESEKAEARAKIEEIHEKLKEGADFAALAAEYSECPSAKNGGDLGFFGRGQMVAPFEEAAFSLKPGELSDIVETQFGYHIIKIVEHKPAGPVEYENAKNRIEQHLEQAKLQEEVAQYVETLKGSATIERDMPE